ncbi:MAG: hypothetical protein JXB10_09385 [Pirellulales bacterium]|nr:hypothetical protein [Pirellulales bacterium]
MSIDPCIANAPFHGQKTSKLGWNSRVCGGTTITGRIGINKSPFELFLIGLVCHCPAITLIKIPNGFPTP